MKRRDLLKAAFAFGAAALTGAPRVTDADSQIDILVDEPLGIVSPEIYGHFIEHIGGVIYDGVWVGEGSKIPNTNGIRTALIEALRRLHAPVIRWPGGCFADSYDWADGVGPRAQRPRRTNFWTDDPAARRLYSGAQSRLALRSAPRRLALRGAPLYETNAFGTSDFVRLCRLSGAQPYIAANVRSLPPLAFDHWVEYCNSPAGSTTLADLRARDGSRQPFNVRYWGVGNESWGCGGNFLPEDYAAEFRRFTTWVPSYGVGLRFVASGPSGDDVDWTSRFFQALLGRRRYFPSSWWGWSVHHYAENLSRGRTEDWIARKGDALRFEPVDYYELLREADRMESIVQGQWNAIELFDRAHRIKLVVDEYGPWYKQGTEVDPTHIFGQQITMRDAIATALTLDMFNRHPEKVAMAACAQLINCLNSLFLAHAEQFIVTPNYHVFDMYAAHQGAQAVRTHFAAPDVSYDRDGRAARFWGLNGSASLRGRTVVLTVTNPHLSEPRETQITVRGANIASGRYSVLTSTDVHAHNTFDRPNAIAVRTGLLNAVRAGTVRMTFDPVSVTRLMLNVS